MERFVAIDLETTGLDPTKDSIIEIGAVRFENGAPVSAFHRLINPGRPIPPAISRLTGITDASVADCPGLDEALPALDKFCEDLPLAGHNHEFDLAFLRQASGQSAFGDPRRWLDTLRLARLVVPCQRSFRLAVLAKNLGLPTAAVHRASDDALACGQLLAELQNRFRSLDVEILDELARLSRGLFGPIPELIADVLRSQAVVFSSRAIRRLPVTVPDKAEDISAPSPTVVSREIFETFLDSHGPLAQILGAFEERAGQKEMLNLVSKAFAEGSNLLVEAGTGVGKSMAYLVPALWWALSSGRRVVVSTGTIQLQEQLWEKDLPILRKALNVSFNAALVKGRSNYLCLRRWREAVEEGESFWSDPERWFFLRVAAWAAQTMTGDRSELDPSPDEEEFWSDVSSEPGNCFGPRCTWYRLCYYQRARRAAECAHLLIVNHSMVMSDIKTGGNLLPEYRYLVIDEAHRLEEVASEHLGPSLNLADAERFLMSIMRRPGRGRPGLLARLASKGVAAGLDKMQELADATRGLFLELASLIDQLHRAGGSSDDDYPQALRIGPWIEKEGEWGGIAQARDDLSASLRKLAVACKPVLEEIQIKLPDDEQHASLSLELEKSAAFALELAEILQEILQSSAADNRVRWIEPFKRRRTTGYLLRSAPLDIGPELGEKLWQTLKSAVLTSATLTVRGDFDHLVSRLGLKASNLPAVIRAVVQSPFSYPDQVLFCLPDGLPDPRELDQNEWTDRMEPLLMNLIEATGGRTLVLFTSHRLLRSVYLRLKNRLEAAGFALLGQGIDGGRGRLAAALMEIEGAVVFGASSFWEGVDVPGPGLSSVILVRLPFQPPNHPVVAARAEAMKHKGASPFYHLMLPDAVIRFRQGFGRLIRSRSDRGIVVVLDPRINPKRARYGRLFLDSLPGPTLKSGPWETLKPAIVGWLRGKDDLEGKNEGSVN